MAISFVIACPECEKKIKVNDQVIGKKIRCKECDAVFPVKRPKDLPEAEPKSKAKDEKAKGEKGEKKAPPKEDGTIPLAPSEDDDDNPNPYGLASSNDAAARCPFCAQELENAEAKICLHCGYDLVARRRKERRAVHEISGEEKFKWRLPGFICVASILILMTTSIIIMTKTKGWCEGSWLQDDEDKSYIVKPGCFMFFNGMLTLFICIALGKFAYKRLFVNNLPPERAIEEGDAEAADAAARDDDDDDDR